jgi:hypothetical protein
MTPYDVFRQKQRGISPNAAVEVVIVTAIVIGIIGYYVGMNGSSAVAPSTTTFATTVTEASAGSVSLTASTTTMEGSTATVTSTITMTTTEVSTTMLTVSVTTTTTTSVSNNGNSGM